MELEKAVEILKGTVKSNNEVVKEARKNRDINGIQLTADLDNQSIAVETVLQELENKDKQVKELKAVNKMQEYRINEMDIPKKKIEDMKEELEEIRDKYATGKTNYINELQYSINILEELLEGELMESKAEIITKRELERWKNVENIEEIPPEALRAMYLDLKANSIPKKKIEDKITYWNKRLNEDERLDWILRDKSIINELQELLEV